MRISSRAQAILRFTSCRIVHRKNNAQASRTIVVIIFSSLSLWNEQSQVYQLDFGGRVTLESAKNFQIEFKDKQVSESLKNCALLIVYHFEGHSIRSHRKQLLHARFRMALFAPASFRGRACKHHSTSQMRYSLLLSYFSALRKNITTKTRLG